MQFILGSIYGHIIGDALGNPYKGLKENQISNKIKMMRNKIDPAGAYGANGCLLLATMASICDNNGKCIVKVINIYKADYHDVLPICAQCHRDYEHNFASKLKQKIAIQYDSPVGGTGMDTEEYKNQHRIRNLSNALYRYSYLIPTVRVEQMKKHISTLMGKPVKDLDVEKLSKQKISKPDNYRPHGEMVMEKISNYQEFIEMWRNHFVVNTDPKFMPPMWNISRLIDACKD